MPPKSNQSLLLLLITALFACTAEPKTLTAGKAYSDITDFSPPDTLFRIFEGEEYELGAPCGYVNQKGDTILPVGKYSHCFSDTIRTFGIVVEEGNSASDLIGIDQAGNRLYEIYWFDNGPDYVEEGLFRILRNGKIGFADTTGRVVIEPQFACATSFAQGKAKVTFECELVSDPGDDHKRMESDSWFFVDRGGRK